MKLGKGDYNIKIWNYPTAGTAQSEYVLHNPIIIVNNFPSWTQVIYKDNGQLLIGYYDYGGTGSHSRANGGLPLHEGGDWWPRWERSEAWRTPTRWRSSLVTEVGDIHASPLRVTAKKCHCKGNVTVTSIVSIRRSFFWTKKLTVTAAGMSL